MKNLKTFKKIFILLLFASFFSCNNDDNDSTHALVGEWQRSDFSTDFEYKLVFNSDFTGYSTELKGNEETGIISNATMLKWSTNKDQLSIDFDDETISTTYCIKSDGVLTIHHFSDLTFTKIN